MSTTTWLCAVICATTRVSSVLAGYFCTICASTAMVWWFIVINTAIRSSCCSTGDSCQTNSIVAVYLISHCSSCLPVYTTREIPSIHALAGHKIPNAGIVGNMRLSYAKFLHLLETNRIKRVIVYGDLRTAIVEVPHPWSASLAGAPGAYPYFEGGDGRPVGVLIKNPDAPNDPR